MAQGIGIAAGVLELANFTFQSSVSLYEAVKSFKSHKKRVTDLLEELKALGEVLQSLREVMRNSASTSNFANLSLPLRRCGIACKDYEIELEKSLLRSGGDRTSFRDWARMKYMGDDIDGFRRLLAGYKATLCVALTDATLRFSSANARDLMAYTDLVRAAQADIEDRLETMDDKLDTLLRNSADEDEAGEAEVSLIREERISAEKCLEICAQLSDHISAIQLRARSSHPDDGRESTAPAPEEIFSEGLEECKQDLARTVLRLEGHEQRLFERMMERSQVHVRGEETTYLLELKDDWQATRQSRDVCSRALERIKTEASSIENYALGDAFQIMVSTNQKTIHGKNRGLGWRTRQVGGHMTDETLQNITRAFANVHTSDLVPEQPLESENITSSTNKSPETESVPKFPGHGHTLGSSLPQMAKRPPHSS